MKSLLARALAKPWRVAWWLAALSLLLRVALVAQAGRFEMPQRAWDRGYEVGAVAASLAEGRAFSDPFGAPSGPTAAVAPAVAALWALPMSILGTDSPIAWAIIVLLDCLALSLIVPALFALGCRVAGERFGLACALAWSIHPMALLLARGYLSSLAWFALAVVVVVERMLAAEDEGSEPLPRGAPWLSLGLAWGVSAWIEPLLGLIVVTWIAWAFVARRPHARMALRAALIAALVVSPWIARNAIVLKTPSLRAAAGPELMLGALAGPGEETPIRVHPSRNRVELERLQQVGETQFNREKLATARELIAAAPARWMASCAWRLGNFWMGRASWWSASSTQPIVAGSLSALRGMAHAGLAILALGGLISAWGSVRATRVLALVFLLYPLPYAMTHVEARYRLPIEPLLAVAACLLLLRIPRVRALLAVGADTRA